MKLNVDLENHSYPIYIERNAIQKVHKYIPVSRKIAIITDTGVPKNGSILSKNNARILLYAPYRKVNHPNVLINIKAFRRNDFTQHV